MKYLIILAFFATSLKAQDSSVNKAGVYFRKSKNCQIYSFITSSVGIYSLTKQDKGFATVCFLASGILQVASITYHYKGCNMLIKANGITIEF